MEFKTLDDVKKGSAGIDPGDQIAFLESNGRVRIGTARVRHIFCGKSNCKKCPHHSYLYAQYRDGKKVKDKYIGVYQG